MNKKCPWCESENLTEFLNLKDFFLTQEEFKILTCNNCKLLFTYPAPPPPELAKYYKSENYLSHNDNKKGLIPAIYKLIKKINIKNKYKMATDDMSDFSLLDIGCGVGDFLLYAKEYARSIDGIEPDPDARKIAENKLNINIFSPEKLNDINDASYDIVTMWHVLEHVADLKNELLQLQRILKTNGKLVLALPNYKSYDAIYYKDKWAAYDVPRHLLHFSQESINNIFQDTSLQLVDTKPLKWDSFYISMLSEQYLNASNNLLNALLIGCKSNIKAKKSGNYSSLVYIFKKKS